MGHMKKKTKKKTKSVKDREYNPAEWDDSKTVEVNPEPRSRSGVSTSIRLPKDMVAKLRKIAMKKGDIGYQTLIKIWIAERLEDEINKAG